MQAKKPDLMFEEEFRGAIRDKMAAPHADKLWAEILRGYTQRGRHYHGLAHLEQVYQELISVRDSVEDWNTLMFSLAYHDFIYQVRRQDNEERSAEIGKQRLLESGGTEAAASRCRSQILATKAHAAGDDPDAALFCDADLSILGASPEIYQQYAKAIRREYRIFPDFLYRPGRRKVLQHFLQKERIYQTASFADRYEAQSRLNLQDELQNL